MSITTLERLFSPTRLGAVALANRIVMAPMTRSRADRDGVPSPTAATYYRQRAGAGLIVTEGTQPSFQGQGYARTPGIHTPEQVRGWRAVTEAVHEAGGRIALQIMHVGRVGHPLNQREPVGLVAPSAIAAAGTIWTDQEQMVPMATPRALTVEEIGGVVEEHRRATELALEAGFDAVELHGANGYLGQQFLSPKANQRDDAYGGSAENRSRFVVEALDAMVRVAGADRVGLRISPGGKLNDLDDPDTQGTYEALLRAIAPKGLAWVHFMHTGWPQEGLYPLVTAPRIVTGGYDGAKADAALVAGATAVGFGAPFVANPDLPERLRQGWPLAAPDPSTFFAGGEKGYADYPTYQASSAAP